MSSYVYLTKPYKYLTRAPSLCLFSSLYHTQVHRCLQQLHQSGPRVVAITSAELSDYPDKLCCIISEVVMTSENDVLEGAKRRKEGGQDGKKKEGEIEGEKKKEGDHGSTTPTSPPYLRVCNVIVPKLSPKKDHDGTPSSFAFTGTGDCAAALLLAWHDILGDNQVM